MIRDRRRRDGRSLVFDAVGYDPRSVALSFGMGLEVLAMLVYGIYDIRYFDQNESRVLNNLS